MGAHQVLSPRILRAVNVAAAAHDGHYRKGSGIPYVSHIFSVMHVASKQGLDPEIEEDVLIACLLHDTIEDVPEKYSSEDILADFGPQVLDFVLSVTKDSSLPNWQARAHAYIERLNAAPYGAVVVAACDKLHNLSSMLADHEQVGEALWQRFSSAKEDQKWWYQAIYDVVERRAPGLPLLPEYAVKLRRLESL
ncbi:guanosine polyphosphate pyrophosphohydrolase [Corynebacterium phocae]|uniref:Guanosine polyphosphate pyrophosphohydrolase n=2 Tax=Corynebacterium phocae TaxID=161895 RepID=A0A1L7D3A0_9CORY|nr:guanosine polyphosphate pyrophosphohydrolase [Corynebacterium phocae]KAA8724196.1 bifunctional (p)ppGpp synthetase/guanosine-3',5'-bis(diphosphate) 3'-pyrophosphohydrolase [Corynebacterium phocae]